jgi:hypothetical protein
MTIEFTDREYIFEHGKRPRGYGCWCFEFEGYQHWEHGTLTEAKKQCRKFIKEVAPEDYKGLVLVNVAP